jgi:hypothetical protein
MIYRQVGREALRARFPAAVLVQAQAPAEPAGESSVTIEFRGSLSDDLSTGGLGEVRPLIKRSTAVAFQTRIGIGRGAGVDLSFPHPGMSKYHAYFEQDAQGRWTVTDAGSKNGTAVNGEQLKNGVPRALEEGDRLHFGKVGFLFYTSEGFVRLVADGRLRS